MVFALPAIAKPQAVQIGLCLLFVLYLLPHQHCQEREHSGQGQLWLTDESPVQVVADDASRNARHIEQ